MTRIVVVAGTAAGHVGTSRSPKEDELRVWHDEGEKRSPVVAVGASHTHGKDTLSRH